LKECRILCLTEPVDFLKTSFDLNEEKSKWDSTKVEIIYGSSNKYDYEKEFYDQKDDLRFLTPDRHFFPLYFLYHMFVRYSGVHSSPPAPKFKPTVHFTCYNNNPRPHRLILLHYLQQNNLLESNYYSFLQDSLDVNFYTSIYKFDFTKFNVKKRDLEKVDNIHNAYYNFSTSFTHSAFQIVTETTDNHIFLTEKTFYPILGKKPFITFGAPYTNEILKDFGFKLYDTIFDYSFDKVMDTKERAKALSEEVLRVCNKYTSHQIYNELYPIAIYNYNVAIDILRNKKFIPDIFFEWDNKFNSDFVWRGHLADWYYNFERYLNMLFKHS
jgi:hemoglobin-like flavoprotein